MTIILKRDDLIHPVVQGNKWRKLHLLLYRLRDEQVPGIISFGGAFSNALHALALAGPLFHLKTAAIIRGTQADLANPTLADALAHGMELFPVPRQEYDLKTDSEIVQAIIRQFPGYYVLPEGGATREGILGCMDISREILDEYQGGTADLYVAVPAGTGCTAAGIVAGLGGVGQVLVFPAARYGVDAGTLEAMLAEFGMPFFDNFQFLPEYTKGRFARPHPDIIAYARHFYQKKGVLLDPIYTSRMMYGLNDLYEKGFFTPNSVVYAVHTGGTQGWLGWEAFENSKKI